MHRSVSQLARFHNLTRKPSAALHPIASKAGHGKYAVEANELSQTELDTSRDSRLESLAGSVVPFILAPVRATIRINRDQTIKLPDGAAIKFSGHGHKSTRSGQRSPLIVQVTFAAPGESKMEEFATRLFPEEPPQFAIGPDESYLFELVQHEYDRWMVVRYFGRVEGFLR